MTQITATRLRHARADVVGRTMTQAWDMLDYGDVVVRACGAYAMKTASQTWTFIWAPHGSVFNAGDTLGASEARVVGLIEKLEMTAEVVS